MDYSSSYVRLYFKTRQLVKRLLVMLPFKRPLFLGLRAIGVTPPFYQNLFFTGPFDFVLEDKKVRMVHTSYQVENNLFWKGIEGDWEKTSLHIWISVAKDARVILDIGANTGAYSLIAKSVNPDARIIAFEPLPKAIEYFKKNCELNMFDVTLYEKALSNFEGEAVVHLETSEDFAYAVAVNKKLQVPEIRTRELVIQTTTLNKVIEEQRLECIDLIKIDVEGHEPEVLETIKDRLQCWRPVILIEILTDDMGKRIEEIVGDVGYHYFNIDESGNVERVQRLSKSFSYNFLLCPPDRAERYVAAAATAKRHG